MKTHNPKSIANFFLEIAESEGKKLTPLKVIKLVYIAHGWHLVATGQPPLNEPPEAWKYGPVIPSLYQSLKEYGSGPIAKPIEKVEIKTIQENGRPKLSITHAKIEAPNDDELRIFLRKVWDAYGHLSGIQLSSLTHQPGTPWEETWEKQGGKYSRGVDIPEELILRHYQKLNEANEAVGGK